MFMPPLPAIRNLRPTDGIASYTSTRTPPWASASAAISPAGPPPTTATQAESGRVDMLCIRERGGGEHKGLKKRGARPACHGRRCKARYFHTACCPGANAGSPWHAMPVYDSAGSGLWKGELGAAPEAHPANPEAIEILKTRGPCRRMLQCSVI